MVMPFKVPQWKEVHVLAAHIAAPPSESSKSAAHDFGRLTFAIADYVRFAPSFLPSVLVKAAAVVVPAFILSDERHAI